MKGKLDHANGIPNSFVIPDILCARHNCQMPAPQSLDVLLLSASTKTTLRNKEHSNTSKYKG